MRMRRMGPPRVPGITATTHDPVSGPAGIVRDMKRIFAGIVSIYDACFR